MSSCSSLYVFSGWDVSETFNVYDDSIISGSWSEKKNMELGEFTTTYDSFSGPVDGFTHIAYGNGTFVILTNSFGSYTSMDGETWIYTIVGSNQFKHTTSTLTFFKGYFYVVAIDYTELPFYSVDGITWKRVSGTMTENISLKTIDDSTYSYAINWYTGFADDDIIIHTGNWGKYSDSKTEYISIIKYSFDGINWTVCQFADATTPTTYIGKCPNDAYIAMSYKFDVVFSLCDNKYYYISNDAIQWEKKSTNAIKATNPNLSNTSIGSYIFWQQMYIIHHPNYIIFAASLTRSLSGVIFHEYYKTSDGITWQIIPENYTGTLYYMNYLPNFGFFARNKDSGPILYSIDLINWTDIGIESSSYIQVATNGIISCILCNDKVIKCEIRDASNLEFVN